jgi:hypothetical protein
MPDQPAAVLNEEGNFTEDFYNGLDDDIKGAPVLREANNPKAMAKMLVNAQSKLGKNRIPLPGENAKPEEWHDVYVQLGKPRTVDDYPYKRPEDVPEDKRTPEHLKVMRETAFKRNWTVEQWNAHMADEDARLVDEAKTAEINARGELEEAENRLKDVLGMAYEERIHLADLVINQTTAKTEADKKNELFPTADEFIKKYGRDPVFIAWASELGKTLVEHEALIAELTQKAPKEAQAELDDLMASDEYSKFLSGELARTNKSKHDAILRRRQELYDIINPVRQAG